VPTVGQQPAIHRLEQKEQYITLRLRHEIFIAYLAIYRCGSSNTTPRCLEAQEKTEKSMCMV
jgi:hypothetical protein